MSILNSRLDGPAIESRWAEISSTCLDPPWGPPSLLYSGYRISFPWVKRSGLGADHPASSCAEVDIITGFHGLFEGELYLLQVRSLHLIKYHAMTTHRRVEVHTIFTCVREMRNKTISFVMYVCVRLSAWNNSAPTGRISIKFDILRFFQDLSRKFKVLLKSGKNNWYFIWRRMYIYDTSLNSS